MIAAAVRTFVIGDPQAAFATVMAILGAHGLLAGDRLAPDVRLISIGDHFDYDFDDWATSTREGLRVLRWLAAHAPEQVVLLAGNHDLARVQELALIDDAGFAEARALARDRARHAEFRARFPHLPTPGLAARDYASFSVEQRDLVRELVATGRMRLATTGVLPDGRTALLTHAGVTSRELAVLEATGASAETIAGALNAYFAAAVTRGLAPLDLAPLHVAGAPGEEGGGLLYHRPSNPARTATGDKAWAWNVDRPRRFDPRTLPRGLVQVAGHSGHHKCLEELGDDWSTPAARARPRGGIRTLAWDGARVTYDLGVAPPDPDAAHLVLIDGEMRRVAPTDYQLLRLA